MHTPASRHASRGLRPQVLPMNIPVLLAPTKEIQRPGSTPPLRSRASSSTGSRPHFTVFFDQTEPIAVLPLFPLHPPSLSQIRSTQSNQPTDQSILPGSARSKSNQPIQSVHQSISPISPTHSSSPIIAPSHPLGAAAVPSPPTTTTTKTTNPTTTIQSVTNHSPISSQLLTPFIPPTNPPPIQSRLHEPISPPSIIHQSDSNSSDIPTIPTTPIIMPQLNVVQPGQALQPKVSSVYPGQVSAPPFSPFSMVTPSFTHTFDPGGKASSFAVGAAPYIKFNPEGDTTPSSDPIIPTAASTQPHQPSPAKPTRPNDAIAFDQHPDIKSLYLFFASEPSLLQRPTQPLNGHQNYSLLVAMPRFSHQLKNALDAASRCTNCANADALFPLHSWKRCPFHTPPHRATAWPAHHSPIPSIAATLALQKVIPIPSEPTRKFFPMLRAENHEQVEDIQVLEEPPPKGPIRLSAWARSK